MATGNRIKQNVEGSKQRKSPLTSAGKVEEIEKIDEVIAEQDNKLQDIEKEIQNIKINDNINSNQKKEEPITNNEVASDKEIKQEKVENFSFVIQKKEKQDVKKPKIYNLKLENIDKVKELASKTNKSESWIIEFLIENGLKIITIK